MQILPHFRICERGAVDAYWRRRYTSTSIKSVNYTTPAKQVYRSLLNEPNYKRKP